jgi:hypothetical protein
MYFALAIGVLNLVRWMMCAANGLVIALLTSSEGVHGEFRGTRKFR